jgi:hypothetical protein
MEIESIGTKLVHLPKAQNVFGHLLLRCWSPRYKLHFGILQCRCWHLRSGWSLSTRLMSIGIMTKDYKTGLLASKRMLKGEMGIISITFDRKVRW